MDEALINFDVEVIQKSKELPVVVDFWAPWCGPCQVLGPVIEDLANEANGKWDLVKVNVDNHQQEAAAYNVRGIPAVKLFIEGEVKAEFSGALPKQQIRDWLEKHIPSEISKAIEAQILLLSEGKNTEAEAGLKKIILQDPSNAKAAFYLAKILLIKDTKTALELFTVAEQKPEFIGEVLTLRRFAEILLWHDKPEQLEEAPIKPIFIAALSSALNGDLSDALERFIDIILKNKAYQNEAAREACIGIFVMLGPQHELTKKYRKRFDMALY